MKLLTRLLLAIVLLISGPAFAQSSISNMPAVTSLSGSELVPVVQGVGVGSNKKATVQQLLGGQVAPVLQRIRAIGDSKSAEPLNALRWPQAMNPRAVELVTQNIGQSFEYVGGSTTGSGTDGLISATRMAGWKNLITTDVAAGYTVDVIITSGTNDAGAGIAAETTVANIRRACNEAFASGARYCVVMSIDPRGTAAVPTTGTGLAFITSVNAGYAKLAAELPRVRFVNTFPSLNDWAAAGIAMRGPTSGEGALSIDPSNLGLHLTSFGTYQKSLGELTAFFNRTYPAKDRRIPMKAEATAAGYPRVALSGNNLRTTAIGGTDSTTKADTASVTGTPPAGYTATGALSGTMTVAFSAANCPAAANPNGAPIPCVRVAFSGTPATTDQMTLQVTTGSVTSGLFYRHNVTAYLEGVQGFVNPLIVSNNNFGLTTARLGSSTLTSSLTAAEVIPTVADGLYTLEAPIGAATNNNQTFEGVQFRWFAGRAVAGSFYLVGQAVWQDPALPTATP